MISALTTLHRIDPTVIGGVLRNGPRSPSEATPRQIECWLSVYRINAICPGAIDTPMLRNAIERRGRDESDVISRLSLNGRFGTVDEIAKATLWLCSDDASFTMGHALAVDSGYLAR